MTDSLRADIYGPDGIIERLDRLEDLVGAPWQGGRSTAVNSVRALVALAAREPKVGEFLAQALRAFEQARELGIDERKVVDAMLQGLQSISDELRGQNLC